MASTQGIRAGRAFDVGCHATYYLCRLSRDAGVVFFVFGVFGKELRMAGKQHDDVMTIDELAAYLKLSKSSLYQFARAGKVPGVKIGQQWRFHKDVIDTWIRDGVPPAQAGGKAKRPRK